MSVADHSTGLDYEYDRASTTLARAGCRLDIARQMDMLPLTASPWAAVGAADSIVAN